VVSCKLLRLRFGNKGDCMVQDECVTVQTASLPTARRQALDYEVFRKTLGICFLLLERTKVAISAFRETGSREAAEREAEKNFLVVNGSDAADAN
jgi:hypothetical protein